MVYTEPQECLCVCTNIQEWNGIRESSGSLPQRCDVMITVLRWKHRVRCWKEESLKSIRLCHFNGDQFVIKWKAFLSVNASAHSTNIQLPFKCIAVCGCGVQLFQLHMK